MAEQKTGVMLSGALATLAATLPLETSAQGPAITLYGRWNITNEAVKSSPWFGVQETATGNVPVTQGDSHVHGDGWTFGLGGRFGVRDADDLARGSRAGFWVEASGSTGSTTTSAIVTPGTDRTRIFYLTPSPFGLNPTSIGLGFTGLESEVTTRVRNYIGKAVYEWQDFTIYEPWGLRGRPSLAFHDLRLKYDLTAVLNSATFGQNLFSNTQVHMRDSYYGAAGGYGITWLPGRGPNDIPPVGQIYPAFVLDGNVALLRRDSSRHANQLNSCIVQPCGPAENFSTGIDSLNNGWTWSAGARLEARVGYRPEARTTFYGTVAGGYNYLNEMSRFSNSSPTTPARFSVGSGSQRYVGFGLGVSSLF